MGRPPFDFGSQFLKAPADYHRMATVLISPGRRFGATRCGPGRSYEGMLPRRIHGRRRRTLRPTTCNLSGVLEGLEMAQSGPCDCPRNLPFLIRRLGNGYMSTCDLARTLHCEDEAILWTSHEPLRMYYDRVINSARNSMQRYANVIGIFDENCDRRTFLTATRT
jgi:hypothetical protein